MFEVKKIYNLLNKKEVEYLNLVCDDYIEDGFQLYKMRYLKENELLDYKEKIISFVTTELNFNFQKVGHWINKVSSYDIEHNNFHNDDSDLTIVTYFKMGFEGGNFEYFDSQNKLISIKPEIGLSLLMDNKLKHRIGKIKNGERYSLVSFFNVTSKKTEKTIL